MSEAVIPEVIEAMKAVNVDRPKRVLAIYRVQTTPAEIRAR